MKPITNLDAVSPNAPLNCQETIQDSQRAVSGKARIDSKVMAAQDEVHPSTSLMHGLIEMTVKVVCVGLCLNAPDYLANLPSFNIFPRFFRPAASMPYQDPDVTLIAQAIIGQESGGNCSAINPDSGALGCAQIMPENLPTWSYEAIGRQVKPAEFLANPQLQHRIIAHRMGLYYQEGLERTGNTQEAIRYVAAAWYSGNGTLKDNYAPQIWHPTGTVYPSIGDYSNQVLARWEKLKAQ